MHPDVAIEVARQRMDELHAEAARRRLVPHPRRVARAGAEGTRVGTAPATRTSPAAVHGVDLFEPYRQPDGGPTSRRRTHLKRGPRTTE